MIRIAGINIPDNKRIEISLTYIYGIGRTTSQKILDELGIDRNIRTKDLVEGVANKLREAVEKELSRWFPIWGAPGL